MARYYLPSVVRDFMCTWDGLQKYQNNSNALPSAIYTPQERICCCPGGHPNFLSCGHLKIPHSGTAFAAIITLLNNGIKDNPCLFFIMSVQAHPVIAIVIDLPSFLLQKFRQEIRLIVIESNFSAI